MAKAKAKAKAAKKPPTKTEIFANIAETTGLGKKDVSAVFDALVGEIEKALSKRGPRAFTIPGLAKIVVQHKPAVKGGPYINPFTKLEAIRPDRPARDVVKVRPLKGLKDIVA